MKAYLELELDIEYEYTPLCKGSRNEYGVPMEPDSPEDMEITAIMLGDLNIIDKLDADDIQSLKPDCWEDMAANSVDAAEYRAECARDEKIDLNWEYD